MATRDLTKTDSQLAARCAAIASLGAGAIHVAVAPMHWRDWMPSGVFFAVLATFQVLWAILAFLRPSALVLAAGIGANAGAAALWVTSCVAGPPFGPNIGQPETVGAAGISVLLLQCYVVMGAGWAWAHLYRPGEISGFGRAFVLMCANTIMAGAVAVGLVASLQGHHHHHVATAEAQGDHPAIPSEPQPTVAEAQPLTDMSRDIVVEQHRPAAPVQPQQPTMGSDRADGHQHHHDD